MAKALPVPFDQRCREQALHAAELYAVQPTAQYRYRYRCRCNKRAAQVQYLYSKNQCQCYTQYGTCISVALIQGTGMAGFSTVKWN
jgi:hypothetical protein